MRISIVIPTLNNINYLKIALESIRKNSNYEHEIIVHVNENKDNTLDYLKSTNTKHTFSKENLGLCSSVNKASKLVTTQYVGILCDDERMHPYSTLNCIKFLNSNEEFISCIGTCHFLQ